MVCARGGEVCQAAFWSFSISSKKRRLLGDQVMPLVHCIVAACDLMQRELNNGYHHHIMEALAHQSQGRIEKKHD